jgi:hypothetical protein
LRNFKRSEGAGSRELHQPLIEQKDPNGVCWGLFDATIDLVSFASIGLAHYALLPALSLFSIWLRFYGFSSLAIGLEHYYRISSNYPHSSRLVPPEDFAGDARSSFNELPEK